MAKHIPIAEIADWLHPATSEWKALVLLNAYFDESGTHAASTITAIAGYVASKDVWSALERQWTNEIGLFADKGVSAFHMHDAILGEGEYAHVEHFHRMAHIKRLSELLRDSDIHAIGVWVDNNDWDAVVTDPKFLSAFPTPYDLCFEHIVRWLRGWSKQRAGGEHIVPMFAYHPEYSPRTSRLYGAQNWYRDVLGAIAFDYPARVPALQTADFVAHQLRYDAHHISYDELTLANMGATRAFANATAKNGTSMFRGYDAGALPGAVKRFSETGRIL